MGEILEEKKVDWRNKWQAENQERIILMTPKDPRKGPTKAQIKEAARIAGMSVNSWLLELVSKELFG